MSKKKQKPNGFAMFMREMQDEFSRQGKRVSMRDMPTFAGPKWAQLSDAKKQAYQVLAKQQWSGRDQDYTPNPDLKPPLLASDGTPRPGRMDSTGMLLSERRDLAAEMSERRAKEKELFKSSLPTGRAVANNNFYFIDFQSLCEVTIKGETQYLPCEVAAVEFSLVSGVKRKLHKFIDPGKIPMGYRFQALSTSETTHQIPIAEFELAEKDYRKILGEIENFLDPNWTEEMPPVFSKREHARKCEYSLGWLADKAGVMNRLTKVYEVEAFIGVLSGHLDGKPLSYFQVDELLKTSIYDYEAGTRCDYHNEKETKYCSLAACNIYTFVASECLCPRFGVSLTSAHLPKLTVGGTVTRYKMKLPSNEVARDPEDEFYQSDDDDEDAPPLPVFGRGRGLGRGRIPTVGGQRLGAQTRHS